MAARQASAHGHRETKHLGWARLLTRREIFVKHFAFTHGATLLLPARPRNGDLEREMKNYSLISLIQALKFHSVVGGAEQNETNAEIAINNRPKANGPCNSESAAYS
jgi:hypothetical protein